MITEKPEKTNPRSMGIHDHARHADTRRMRGEEIEARRGERSKTFALGRGMYQTVMYPEQVHYRDRKGDWCEIDNRLQPVAGDEPAMENTTGLTRVRLGAWANADPLVTVRDEHNHAMSWRLEGASGAPAVQGGGVGGW